MAADGHHPSMSHTLFRLLLSGPDAVPSHWLSCLCLLLLLSAGPCLLTGSTTGHLLLDLSPLPALVRTKLGALAQQGALNLSLVDAPAMALALLPRLLPVAWMTKDGGDGGVPVAPAQRYELVDWTRACSDAMDHPVAAIVWHLTHAASLTHLSMSSCMWPSALLSIAVAASVAKL